VRTTHPGPNYRGTAFISAKGAPVSSRRRIYRIKKLVRRMANMYIRFLLRFPFLVNVTNKPLAARAEWEGIPQAG